MWSGKFACKVANCIEKRKTLWEVTLSLESQFSRFQEIMFISVCLISIKATDLFTLC